jgi:ribosomal protein S18 acetylase RimI-like enzyme
MGIELTGYAPGDIGRVVALHADYYAAQWDFGRAFEAKVAEELGAFLAGFDAERDGFWAARLDGAMAGSLSIHGRDPGGREPGDHGARLRFFITDPAFQGRGVGRKLMDAAMAFCDEADFKRVWLSTFEGLDPARRLYERHGFRLIETHPGGQWGREVQEQTFERLR